MSLTGVGPVFQTSSITQVVVEAIVDLNQDTQIIARGGYVRVLSPKKCVLTKKAVSEKLGREFIFPRDLELIMASYKGKFSVTSDQATWSEE
jgi:hypothetical protein